MLPQWPFSQSYFTQRSDLPSGDTELSSSVIFFPQCHISPLGAVQLQCQPLDIFPEWQVRWITPDYVYLAQALSGRSALCSSHWLAWEARRTCSNVIPTHLPSCRHSRLPSDLDQRLQQQPSCLPLTALFSSSVSSPSPGSRSFSPLHGQQLAYTAVLAYPHSQDSP